jgi:hypothetical protein
MTLIHIESQQSQCPVMYSVTLIVIVWLVWRPYPSEGLGQDGQQSGHIPVKSPSYNSIIVGQSFVLSPAAVFLTQTQFLGVWNPAWEENHFRGNKTPLLL